MIHNDSIHSQSRNNASTTKRSITTDMYRSNIYIYIALFHLYTINRHVERDFHSDQSTMLLFVDTSRYYTHNIVQVDGYTGTPIVRQILDPFILWGVT